MIEKGLFDLLAKKGKAGGGFATCIPKFQSPFIFLPISTVPPLIYDVLTHEFGHAFQVYLQQRLCGPGVFPGRPWRPVGSTP